MSFLSIFTIMTTAHFLIVFVSYSLTMSMTSSVLGATMSSHDCPARCMCRRRPTGVDVTSTISIGCHGGIPCRHGTERRHVDDQDIDKNNNIKSSSNHNHGPESLDSNQMTITNVTCSALALNDVPASISSSTSSLDLTSNRITSLTSASFGRRGSLPSLTTLHLSRNAIRDIAADAFAELPTLRVLNLDWNNISRLDPRTFTGTGGGQFGRLGTTLTQLNLAHNQLSSKVLDAGLFWSLSSLVSLDLTDNNLSSLSRMTLRGLSGLRYLLLADNSITHIDHRSFKHVGRLVHLVLKGNEHLGATMTSSSFYFHSPALTYIDLSDCGFTRVPTGLPVSTRYLQLRRNRLTALTRTSLIDTPNLYTLVLDDNLIEEIETGTFEGVTRLQQLWLNNNRLRSVPSDALVASLERLLVDFNRIEAVREIIPRSAVNQLNTLSFSGNNISDIEPGAFGRLPFLDTLRLDNNVVRVLRSGVFSGLNELRVLQLSNNPLTVLSSGCFEGLSSLRTFSLDHVTSEDVLMQEWSVFNDVASTLEILDVDNSPVIARKLFSTATGAVPALRRSASRRTSRYVTSRHASRDEHHAVVFKSLLELSVLDTQLTHFRSDLPSLVPRLRTLRASSDRWRCTQSTLDWLIAWITSRDIALDDGDDATRGPACNRSLGGRGVPFDGQVITTSMLNLSTENGVADTRITANAIGQEFTSSQPIVFKHHQAHPAKVFPEQFGFGTPWHIGEVSNNNSGKMKNEEEEETAGEEDEDDENEANDEVRNLWTDNLLSKTTEKFIEVPLLPKLNDHGSQSDLDTSTSASRRDRSDQNVDDDLELSSSSIKGHHLTSSAAVGRGSYLASAAAAVDAERTNDEKFTMSTAAILTMLVCVTFCVVIVIVSVIVYVTRRRVIGARALDDSAASLNKGPELLGCDTPPSLTSLDGWRVVGGLGGSGEYGVVGIDSMATLGSASRVKVYIAGGGETREADVNSLGSGKHGVRTGGITLVPGRDANHEGPRRVYKWEDF